MTAMSYDELVREALATTRTMPCEALRRRLSEEPRLLVVDLREADECATGAVPGSVHIPRGLLEGQVTLHAPRFDTPLVVYCASGRRSALACGVLQRMGYTDVASLSGGFTRWQSLGYDAALPRTPSLCTSEAGPDWRRVRGEFAIVERRVRVLGGGSRELVYLDHAASTHAPRSVLAAYTEFIEHEYANVHRGTYTLSRKATERFEAAHETVAQFLKAELEHGAVCFTQNTTHALDLASHVVARLPGVVVTTEMEHHSNELTHRERGPVMRCRVTDSGELDLGHLDELLRHHRVKLLAVTAGSNVTGVINDVHRLARMAHEAGALILVDAAQALARLPFDVRAPGDPEHLDFLAGAGHKAYAPFGAGFLYGPRQLFVDAPPYLPGGGTAGHVSATAVEYLETPERHQGGTPNIAGVVGMAGSLSFLAELGLPAVRQHELELTRQAVAGLCALGGVTLYGPQDAESRLGVVSFNVDGIDDLMTAAVLSEEGALAVRNGRFCAHIYVERLLESAHPQHAERPQGAVRASFGLYNDAGDVERLVEFVRRVRERAWVGRYRMKGEQMDAEFAVRCADRWMEAATPSEPPPSGAADAGARAVTAPENP